MAKATYTAASLHGSLAMLPSPEHKKKLNDEMERLCDVWTAAYESELRKTVRTPEQEPTAKDRK